MCVLSFHSNAQVTDTSEVTSLGSSPSGNPVSQDSGSRKLVGPLSKLPNVLSQADKPYLQLNACYKILDAMALRERVFWSQSLETHHSPAI